MPKTLRQTPLLILILLVAPAARGQDASSPFRAEVGAAFVYEGGKTEEPLVSVSGLPSTSFFYRADSVARGLALSGTYFLADVPDDGRTPHALLPFVARVSSATARLSLTGTGRDSRGTSQGLQVSLVSSFTSDESLLLGSLGAEWYFLPQTAVRGSLSFDRLRSTASTSTLELPGERGTLSGIRSRTGGLEVGAGLVQRFGPLVAVSVDGRYRDASLTRTDDLQFTGAAGFRTLGYSLEAAARRLSTAVDVLVADRRLLLSASGSYESGTSDLDQTEPQESPLDTGTAIERGVAFAATWYPVRAAGVTVGVAYGSGSEWAGLTARRLLSSTKTTVLRAGLRWFASPRASLGVSAARTEVTEVNPPDTDTFVKLAGTTIRLEVTGALRF